MTEDEIDTMWQKAMHQSIKAGGLFNNYQFANLVAAKEREACAKVCEEQSERWAVPVTSDDYRIMWAECAAAIRARGEQA